MSSGENAGQYSLVLITVPTRELADKVARTLVSERLAACVNIVPAVKSIYRWNDGICEDDEILLLVKTRSSLFNELKAAVLKVHSYDVPEIIKLSIECGLTEYLQWIDNNVKEL